MLLGLALPVLVLLPMSVAPGWASSPDVVVSDPCPGDTTDPGGIPIPAWADLCSVSIATLPRGDQQQPESLLFSVAMAEDRDEPFHSYWSLNWTVFDGTDQCAQALIYSPTVERAGQRTATFYGNCGARAPGAILPPTSIRLDGNTVHINVESLQFVAGRTIRVTEAASGVGSMSSTSGFHSGVAFDIAAADQDFTIEDGSALWRDLHGPKASLETSGLDRAGRTDFTAHVRDIDGVSDIAEAWVSVTDANGKAIVRIDHTDFHPVDPLTLRFHAKGLKLKGRGPWTFTLWARDSSGTTATEAVSLGR